MKYTATERKILNRLDDPEERIGILEAAILWIATAHSKDPDVRALIADSPAAVNRAQRNSIEWARKIQDRIHELASA